jgi:hypothetical protein
MAEDVPETSEEDGVVMGDLADRRLLLAAARADFLDGVERELRGVPDHVAASWRRSASSGVHHHEVASIYFSDLDLDSRLVRCAGPVIEQLAEQISDIPMCVALTDDQARVVARRDSTSWFGRILDRVYFAEGFDYSERSVGTNGVGTVLEFGQSVQIAGAEHFVEPLQPFACTGAPVRDPLSGRIEGVLDISCPVDQSSPILHSLVRAAATQIERNLLTDRNQTQQALYEAYARIDARTRNAVLAVGQQVLMANTALQTLLDPHDQQALHDHVRFVMGRHPTVDVRVSLPSGAVVRLRGSQITVGMQAAGMVVVVNVLNEADIAAPPLRAVHPPVSRVSGVPIPGRERDSGTAGESKSPAWRGAVSTITHALRRGVGLLVLGERGAGRFTAVSSTFQQLRPGGRIVSISAAEVAEAPEAVAVRLRRRTTPDGSTPDGDVTGDTTGGDTDVLYVLRDIDTLSPRAAGILRAHLEEAIVAPLAATASDTEGADAPHEPLLELFHTSATLPALRHRSADLPQLLTELLAELAPHRNVALSRDAHRLVARNQWPGNLRQLKDALAEALRRRPVGVIEAEDLPTFCHSSPRTALRPVDEAERDAIVAALRDNNGNRVAAAAALGLARSTLYRKIRQYGITA